MTEAQLNAFLEAVKADAALQQKLKAATDSDAVVAIAKEAGFVISAEGLKSAQMKVTEEDLEIIGGARCSLQERYKICIGGC